MPIKFRCPKCRQAYSISSKKAGTSIRCQKCDAKMRIPALEAPTDATPAKEASPSPEKQPVSEQKPEDEANLAAAMRNLLDDEDEAGNDDLVDLSTDKPARKNAQNQDGPAVTADRREAAGGSGEDDDLAAVLAFEAAMEEEDAPAAEPSAPLPDELFAEEEEDDEDE